MNFSATMRKQGLFTRISYRHSHKKIIYQFMRISIVISMILLGTAGVLLATPVNGQDINTEKVTIGLKNQNLETAIEMLEQQTPFTYYYHKLAIKNITNLTLADGSRTVRETLDELLKNTFLTFRQEDQNIFIENTKNQVSYEIKGRVIDKDRKPVEFATVTIRKIKNNEPIQSSQTDTGGYLRLAITEKGDYLIDISSVGMDTLSVALTLADKRVVNLPDIMLFASVKQLKEVSISGKRSFIEEKIDRTIVNVNALISNTGANALEVLEKSPGVIVDGNGNISFKGKPGVLILIDGKPTYLSGDNLTAYLKSLPSSSLDQIELMDNPPAKYDAEGNAGVINIKTKKTKTEGFNGLFTASYGQAHYGQTSESLNLNYHEGKVNLFANAAYGINQSFRELDLGRDYFDPGGGLNSSFRQIQYIKGKGYNANLKFGMDYYLSPKTTWGFVLTGILAPGNFNIPSTDRLYNAQRTLDSVVTAQNTGKNHLNNGGININYSHQFDSTGKAITFDLDYLKYGANSNQSFINQTFLPDGSLVNSQTITDNLPVNINIYAAKTDFTQPLKGKARIDAGLKSSYVNTDNEANYFDVANGLSTVDNNFSNHFLYRENINAAYLNFNKAYKRIEVQAGLRTENTNANGHQLGNAAHTDSSFMLHYTDLFPTAYLSYKLDTAGHDLLVASYGRRIGRPFYKDLNPFILPSDKFTYSEGNPFLKPQFTDNYKLTYNYKGILSTSIYYNHISDLQNEVVRQQGDIFIDGTGNIGSANFLGASVNLSLEPTSWWMLNTYVQLIHNSFKGQLYDSYLNQSSTYGQGNMTSQFTFPSGWSAELSGYYVTRFANGQSIINPFGQLNGGIQKKILHNKGSLKLTGRDLLHTYVADGVTNFIPNATSTFRNRFNSQAFILGFSYSFGSANKQARKRDTGSAGSEASRVRN